MKLLSQVQAGIACSYKSVLSLAVILSLSLLVPPASAQVQTQIVTLPGSSTKVRVVGILNPNSTPQKQTSLSGVFPAPSGTGLGAPYDFVLDGGQVVGLYQMNDDANSNDYITRIGGPEVVSSPLQLVFWGSAWLNLPQGDLAQSDWAENPTSDDVVNMVNQMLAGPYLSELSQYGFQNLTMNIPIINTSSEPPANFSMNDVNNMVWNDLIGKGIPEPDDGGRFVYMVFLPPGTMPSDGHLGEHDDATGGEVFDDDHAWVGYVSYNGTPGISDTLGHELVETITDPEPDNPGWVMDRSWPNSNNEIGDACVNSTDVLDSITFQPYWSQKHLSCVIPFGKFEPLGAAGQAASVARIPNHLDTFWVAFDGSVWSSWWDANANNGNWNVPFVIASPTGAVPSTANPDTLAVTAQSEVRVDAFWASPDGSIWESWWQPRFNYQWRPPSQIVPPNSSWGDRPTAVARSPEQVDLFWIGRDGSVNDIAYDLIHDQFFSKTATVAGAGSAVPGTIAAVARTPDHLDVFWIGPDGAIWSNWWDQSLNEGNGAWNLNPYPVSDVRQNHKAVRGALNAVARTPTHLDVFWVSEDGGVWSNWWDHDANEGRWNTEFNVAPTGSAARGPFVDRRASISAVSRNPQQMDVFWVAEDRSIMSNWWNLSVPNGDWGQHPLVQVSRPGDAYPGSELTAVGRLPDHLDVFWTSFRGQVITTWWDANLNNAQWNPPTYIAPRGSAAR